MEKAKIDSLQLFVLLLLFEMGSAVLIPLAVGAKQDAWLAIFFGMVGGIGLFYVYLGLFQFYPDMLPTEYVQRLLGKVPGWILGFTYMLYFLYIAARVLRDFGSMLITTTYRETPLFIVNTLLMLVVIYTVHKGIEVIARTAELLFVLMYLLAISGFILILASGLIDLSNLKPVLDEGILPVLKVSLTETLYVPFGEAIVFMMVLPYLINPKKARKTATFALILSGVNLIIVMVVNLSVLGINMTERSQFPLLSTIQLIEVANFLERLDVYFLIALILGGFIKITIFFYAAVIGMGHLFKMDQANQLVYPLGLVILFLSITIASSFSEHIQEGLKTVPIFLHLPFQVVIPLLLLGIAYFKNRKKRIKTKCIRFNQLIGSSCGKGVGHHLSIMI